VEKEMYTIVESDGSRDLVLEHRLSDLESRFALLRENKLAKREPIDSIDHSVLCTFVAAMHARTKSRREHHATQWGKVVEMSERMKERAKTFTPEERAAAERRSKIENAMHSTGETLSEGEVKRMATQPLQELLAVEIGTLAPMLALMDFVIIETRPSHPFITSDNPCVWFDAEAYKRPPFYRSPALMYPSTEIRFPISPTQMLILKREISPSKAYFPIKPEFVDDFNRVTRFGSHEFFVSSMPIQKPLWFDPGTEPDDSWEKTHSAEKPFWESH
jgi:hypothetical protein